MLSNFFLILLFNVSQQILRRDDANVLFSNLRSRAVHEPRCVSVFFFLFLLCIAKFICVYFIIRISPYKNSATTAF